MLLQEIYLKDLDWTIKIYFLNTQEIKRFKNKIITELSKNRSSVVILNVESEDFIREYRKAKNDLINQVAGYLDIDPNKLRRRINRLIVKTL